MEWITTNLGIEPATQNQILASILAFLVVLLIRRLVLRYLVTKLEESEDGDAFYRARKVVSYTATTVIIISLTFIWIAAFNDLATFLGLLSAGIAIGLSDLLKNMAGWGYILARRPFKVGDRIEIQETIGDVVDIRLFRFSLMEVGHWVDAEQSTGRLVHVPNGLLFTNKVANYTEGFSHIWEDLAVLITFESDYERAETIIRDILKEKTPNVEATAGQRIRETARRYHIRMGTLSPTVYLSVRDSGVLLTARYLVETRSRRGVAEDVWRAILDSFRTEPTIDLAYPTVRVTGGEASGGATSA
ncbi:MAG: mechanosensitive ion channel family protein [Acidimicrobiia bacterium]|nr:mechanosensitive ion channel family protein [Acidimicrobiia bacterium]MDH3462901.1 mechanosensitive ion channel family protein [Acidimicrobiia bacterium]